MIYYLKQEVKIGDKVDLNGVKVTLTQQIIDDNPELFEVKSEEPIKEYEILSFYAKNINGKGDSYVDLRYIWLPGRGHGNWSRLGHQTVSYSYNEILNNENYGIHSVKRLSDGEIFTIGDQISHYAEYVKNVFLTRAYTLEKIYFIEENRLAFYVGRGLNLGIKSISNFKQSLFKTEDGVDIYEGYYYCASPSVKNLESKRVSRWEDDWLYQEGAADKRSGGNKNFLFFSSKSKAEAWVETNKPKEKSLEDYEDELLTDITSLCTYRDFTVDMRFMWDTFKEREPRLYWTKVLQLIADDLNGDWKPSFTNGGCKYTILSTHTVNCHCGENEGVVYFATGLYVRKAIELMGTNLDYIFK